MKMGALNSVTSGLSILSLSFLLLASCSAESSRKRGCFAYGHSCLGGHGKRSTSDEHIRLKDINVDSGSTDDFARHSSINNAMDNLRSNEIRTLRDIVKCPNCPIQLLRRADTNRNYIPLLRQLLVAHRRSYGTDLSSSDK